MFCTTLATCTDVDGSKYNTGDVLTKKIKNKVNQWVDDTANVCVCGKNKNTVIRIQ